MRAYEQLDAPIRPNEVDREPQVRAAGPKLRSPSGESPLPCAWLFSIATEPVLLVEAVTERIVRANPAAAQLLGVSQGALVGAPMLEPFETPSWPALESSMDRARIAGRADETLVRAGDGAELSAKLSFFRAGAEAYLLVRLTSRSCDGALGGTPRSQVFEAIEATSVGFLVTDAGLRVEYANQAFADMADLSPSAQIHGKSLARWVEFSEDDLATLHDQMLQRQATTVMTARLRSERNLLREVEVCAVAVPDGQSTCWGFTVRELPNLN